MGDLIVAPLLFVLWTRPSAATRPPRQARRTGRARGARHAERDGLPRRRVELSALLFPVLIWATLRFQQFGAVHEQLVVAAFAVTGAVRGTALLGEGSTTEIVQILEGLTAGVAVSLLILGAVLAERSEAQRQLAAAHASLVEAQEVAQVGSWESDIAANRVTCVGRALSPVGPRAAVGRADLRALPRLSPSRGSRTGPRGHRARSSCETPFEDTGSAARRLDRWIAWTSAESSSTAAARRRGLVGTAPDITERKRIDDLRDLDPLSRLARGCGRR